MPFHSSPLPNTKLNNKQAPNLPVKREKKKKKSVGKPCYPRKIKEFLEFDDAKNRQ